MSKRFYFDLETTGLYLDKCDIHQVAAIFEVHGEIVDSVDLKVRPRENAEFSQEALDACGVTKEQVMAYDDSSIGWKALCEKLNVYCDKFDKKDKFHLVGYNNAHFDNGFLRAWWKDHYFGSYFWPNSIDVMVLATDYLQDKRHELLNFKLGTVAEYFGVKADGNLHDAMVDVSLTREIYKKIKGETK